MIQDGSMEASATLLYKKYQDFHTLGNYKYIKTHTSFGREIKRIDGVDKRRTMNGFCYKLELAKIKQSLIEYNEYDEEAMCDA